MPAHCRRWSRFFVLLIKNQNNNLARMKFQCSKERLHLFVFFVGKINEEKINEWWIRIWGAVVFFFLFVSIFHIHLHVVWMCTFFFLFQNMLVALVSSQVSIETTPLFSSLLFARQKYLSLIEKFFRLNNFIISSSSLHEFQNVNHINDDSIKSIESRYKHLYIWHENGDELCIIIFWQVSSPYVVVDR